MSRHFNEVPLKCSSLLARADFLRSVVDRRCETRASEARSTIAPTNAAVLAANVPRAGGNAVVPDLAIGNRRTRLPFRRRRRNAGARRRRCSGDAGRSVGTSDMRLVRQLRGYGAAMGLADSGYAGIVGIRGALKIRTALRRGRARVHAQPA